MPVARVKNLTPPARVVTSAYATRAPQSLAFSTFAVSNKKGPLPPRPSVAEEDTFKRYLKGSGPGGQKINKTSSAVQITHLPTGIVVKSQATRSRTRNESIARRILAEKIEFLEKGSESRVEKKRERESKKKRSAEKKSRRKYRKLAEEKAGKAAEASDDVDELENNEDNENNSNNHAQENQKVK